MDLRKYIKKRVNTKSVLDYEYQYCSHVKSRGRPTISIMIEKGEGTLSSPGYQLLLILDMSGKIEEIMRLRKVFGAGRVIKRFPADVEEKAEAILSKIVIPVSNIDESDLSVLYDIN